jgi:hypothetical protein
VSFQISKRTGQLGLHSAKSCSSTANINRHKKARMSVTLNMDQQISDPVISSAPPAVEPEISTVETTASSSTVDILSSTATVHTTMPPPTEENAEVEIPEDFNIDYIIPEAPDATSQAKRRRGRPKKIPASGRPSRPVALESAQSSVESTVLPLTGKEYKDDELREGEVEIDDAASQLLQDIQESSKQNDPNDCEDADDEAENKEKPLSSRLAPPVKQVKKGSRSTQLEKLLQHQESKTFEDYGGDGQNTVRRSMRHTSSAEESKTADSKEPFGPGHRKESDLATKGKAPRQPRKMSVEAGPSEQTTTKRRNLVEVEIIQAPPNRDRGRVIEAPELANVQPPSRRSKRILAAVEAEDEPL